MRGHEPVSITEFKGLFARGDAESCPMDHFSDCENVQYIQSGFETRDGLDIYPPGVGIFNVVRIYTFVHNGVESILILDTSGNIYDTGSPTPTTPILTITDMADFAFAGYSNRAYISPNTSVHGLQNEFIYVYKGDGVPARKSGGAPPTGSAMTVVQGAAGSIEAGIHIFAVVYETDTGFLTKLGPDAFTEYTAVDGFKADISGVPISPDSFVIARHIVATKAINPTLYTGDTRGYQFFFVPDGKIDDNTGTTITVDFYDADLLDDASHLLDLFTNPPAGVALTIYHNRLVSVAEYGEANVDPDLDTMNNHSIARVSYPGEPEAFDEVDGLITAPLDGLALTNAQEYRDILYLFKLTRTFAYTDNGDAPSSWPLTVIDQGVGAPIHGIATVLDSGGVNVEFLIVVDLSGIILFNGTYQRPELSWKIKQYWSLIIDETGIPGSGLTKLHRVQIYNDSVRQRLYIVKPDWNMIYADYSNGLDPENIRWGPWSFAAQISTITLADINTLVLGSHVEP